MVKLREFSQKLSAGEYLRMWIVWSRDISMTTMFSKPVLLKCGVVFKETETETVESQPQKKNVG